MNKMYHCGKNKNVVCEAASHGATELECDCCSQSVSGGHTILSFLKNVGLQSEVDSFKRYQIVHVNFVNSDGADDETSFDVTHVATKQGNNELAELYRNFCEENNFPYNTVTGITVVASADTKAELLEIDM